MPRITPNLWFDDNGLEATKFSVCSLNGRYGMKKLDLAALRAAFDGKG
jgi:hypothetical protein